MNVQRAFFLLLLWAGMASAEIRLTDWVDPFIGTGGHGHTYPGAALPFGMVQLSPDTRLKGWDGCSGYHDSDSLIYGFSHTHLSGTGVPEYCDILLMPTTGNLRLDNGAMNPDAGYCSRFRKNSEAASPGYYQVHLDDYDIDAALTATLRAGFHRYTFPAPDTARMLIDLTHRDLVLESSIRWISDTEIEGMRRSRSWAEDQVVYFIARFSQPFRTFGIAVHDTIRAGLTEAFGTSIKAFMDFGVDPGTVLVKVGISAVDAEGAQRNLDAEIPDWDFDGIRLAATEAWEAELGRIRVEGGTNTQMRIFYTALYHTFLAPNLFTDVDGRYRGMDFQIHQAEDYTHYTVFSLWDTYRATHPLYTLIQQDRTTDFIRTFLSQYAQGGILPMWELAANYTGCMIGYHAVPVIVDAYVKGIRGFDVEMALEAMAHSAGLDHLGLKAYRRYGHIPVEAEHESVSKTLEYAYDDWCIATMAGLLGQEDLQTRFMRRAQYYKNLFDPDTGFMRARANGGWQRPFNPKEVNFNYTEANAWQYTFYAPQDIEGLIGLMGGREAFIAKLDQLFSEDAETTGRHQVDITGLIGQYAHGNEPSHHMAYLYSYAGAPWKTQAWVRQIMETQYSDQRDGLSGNEDCGQMSAWFVLSALGFYPVTPGSEIYAVGSPLFPRAVIRLEDGNTFTIEAKNANGGNGYIQSAKMNGEDYPKSFIRHQDVISGGSLVFQMGPTPNLTWGVGADNAPRSEIADVPFQVSPVVLAGDRTFTDSTTIILDVPGGNAVIYYSLDRRDTQAYRGPFTLDRSSSLTAFAHQPGGASSHAIHAEFTKVPGGRRVIVQSDVHAQYTAGGDLALIDGIRGGNDFRTGYWQGYQGQDFEAVVDLGEVMPVRRLGAGFFQETRSWILMPVRVVFEISLDGRDFREVAVLENDVPAELLDTTLKDFQTWCDGLRARFVRVRAENFGKLPEWHLGAGGEAYIFIDEIIIN